MESGLVKLLKYACALVRVDCREEESVDDGISREQGI